MSDYRLIQGDCVEFMKTLPESSIDAVVCDPPYGIEFMGTQFDKLGEGEAQEKWHRAWCVEALRVLKPGGHLLAFGSPRTYHRLAAAVEDAGFELRDSIMWCYSSGMPKGLSIGKAIDKALGAKRTKVIGQGKAGAAFHYGNPGEGGFGRTADKQEGTASSAWEITAPETDEAIKWEGWNTTLKPTFEPVVVARKALVGTVVSNILAHGTGALNIDACRVPFVSEADEKESKEKNRHGDFDSQPSNHGIYSPDKRTGAEKGNYNPPGRWPANLMLSHSEKCVKLAEEWACVAGCSVRGLDKQSDGASRFFMQFEAEPFIYCPKAGKKERDEGLSQRNSHVCVKPMNVMKYLIQLVTPPGGLVLDPFAGSGSTGVAALRNGFSFLGVEQEEEYYKIAQQRLEHAKEQS